MRFVLSVKDLIIIWLMASLLNMSSSRLIGSKVLPYDAEIEYLESTGTQWIDTSFIPTGNDIRIQTKVLYKGFSDSTAYAMWFGAYTNEQSNTYRIIRNGTSTSYMFLYNGTKASGGAVSFLVTIGNIYNIDFNRNRYTINTTSGNFNTAKGNENSGYLTVFSNKFKGAFFFFRLWKNDVLILDLIPVRVGQVGYMYDKVSGQLFGNQGTGSFILGADKN